MSSRDTLSILADELALALQPLMAAFSSPEGLRDFLEELGWDFATAPSALETLRAPVEQVYNLASSSGQAGAGNIDLLLDGVRSTFNAISDLRSTGGLADDFRTEFPRQLVDYLLVEYLLGNQPRLGYLLLALGIIRLEEIPEIDGRPPYLRRVFAVEDLGSFFSNPLLFFRGVYQWGQSDFAGERIIGALAGLLEAWGLRAREEQVDMETLDDLNAGALQPDETFDSALYVALIEDSVRPAEFGAGLGIFLLPETVAIKPGFALLPSASGEFDDEVAVSERVSLRFKGSVDLTGGVGALVRPDRDIEFLLGIGSGTPSSASGTLAIVLQMSNPGEPFVLLGSPGANRFEVSGVSITAGTRFHSNGQFEIVIECAIEHGKIVIQPDRGGLDGFLAELLPQEGIQAEVDLTVGLSTTQGLYFAGSGGLEVSLPVHIQLGPIETQSALFGAKFKDGSLPIEFAATVKADLGVLTAVVENVGAKMAFMFPPDDRGNLGPVDFTRGFRAPNGVGLAVDVGVVKGGGYLYFDAEREEYAGALELVFSEWLSLKAIGLITTRMPDASKGFSLLVIITAEGLGIQLGFGFVLDGVGGLLGLNRSMRLQPLLDGVRTGAIQSVMFPQDVVANAPRIISDLRTFFPPASGIFLIGPMAKITWGTPILVTLSLGIIIEIPGNIAILGVLKVVLPDQDAPAPVLLLQVNFFGAIEFDKSRGYFFAATFESRLLEFTLEAEMGLLVAWGRDSNFVVSVGGFHPQFRPPPLPFPTPKRVSLTILNESYGCIRVMGYFAVTSNTAQFGARMELWFGFSEFKIDGHLGLDALFQFNPFFMIVEISGRVSLKVFGVGAFGVSLRFTLEGPTPWRAKGYGKIKLLFFSFKASFDLTWGQRRETTLPPIEVMPILVAEFDKAENWTAVVPPENHLLVSLRPLSGGPGTLVLHPVGTLVVSQRAVPLDITLDKVGSQKPSDANRFSLSVSDGLKKVADFDESFAIAQFQNFTDAQKLSKPAFQPQHGGLQAGTSDQAFQTGPATEREVRYEPIIIDTNYRRYVSEMSSLEARLFELFLNGNAVSRAPISHKASSELQLFADSIEVGAEGWAVASSRNNTRYKPDTVFASEPQAREYMNVEVAKDPALADALHVIPQYELSEVA